MKEDWYGNIVTEHELVEKIKEAYNNPGPHPTYHKKVIKDVERLWPVMGVLLRTLAGHDKSSQ